MAKGQKRSSREPKKPKQPKVKVVPSTSAFTSTFAAVRAQATPAKKP
ncbi:hypothetical protein [Rhodovastum atsumiense]|nr:hypothetical protein [Rhodovastum atsumiense]